MIVLWKCKNGWIQTDDVYPSRSDMPNCLIFKTLTEFLQYHEPQPKQKEKPKGKTKNDTRRPVSK